MGKKRRDRTRKVWMIESGGHRPISPISLQAEARGTQVQVLPGLQSKLNFSLNLSLSVRPCPEIKSQREELMSARLCCRIFVYTVMPHSLAHILTYLSRSSLSDVLIERLHPILSRPASGFPVCHIPVSSPWATGLCRAWLFLSQSPHLHFSFHEEL